MPVNSSLVFQEFCLEPLMSFESESFQIKLGQTNAQCLQSWQSVP